MKKFAAVGYPCVRKVCFLNTVLRTALTCPYVVTQQAPVNAPLLSQSEWWGFFFLSFLDIFLTFIHFK